MASLREADRAVLEVVMKKLLSLVKKPENYLSGDEATTDGLKSLTKDIFDLNMSCLENSQMLPIQELLIKDFDQEQIWQELELLNELEWSVLTADITSVSARCSRLALDVRPVGEPAGSDEGLGDVSGGSAEEAHSEGDGVGEDDVLSDDEGLEEGDGGEEDSGSSEAGEDATDSGSEIRSAAAERTYRSAETTPPRGRSSVVDDQFFKLDELEQFLQQQDREFERQRSRYPSRRTAEDEEDSESDVDMFAKDAGDEDEDMEQDKSDGSGTEDGQEGGEQRPMYGDFFDPPEAVHRVSRDETKNRIDLLASDSEGEDVTDIVGSVKKSDENRSTLEVRQDKLKLRIAQLEEENLSEKPWQLRGETSAAARHENALLEEYVEFDQTKKAPLVTADVTAEIERLILRRVRDQAWDDVQRKVKPVEDPYDYKKRLLLDQEKSKLSLAQIYEQEYLKQKSEAEQKPADDLGMDVREEQEDVPKEHQEIKDMMSELFAKLDALTNFHYVPKQSSAEVKVISKLPAIVMEETTPVAASSATLLAPEEIKDKSQSVPLAKEERSDADKKRERRKKKRRQGVKARVREASERRLAQLDPEKRASKASRLAAESQLKRLEKLGQITRVDSKGGNKRALKSSSAFYSQLNEQVTVYAQAKNKTKQPAGGKKKTNKMSTAADVAKMRL